MIRLPTCDRRYQTRRQKEKHDEKIRKLEERYVILYMMYIVIYVCH